MKKLYYIERLASSYFDIAVIESLYKKANLLSNMAARVMHSTLPYNEQQNNIVALQSLLPGAKELFEYGVKACMDEIQFSRNGNAEDNVVMPFAMGNIEESLNNAIKIFSNDDLWDVAYGGKPWINITKNLLSLYKTIKNIEEAKKKKDWEQYEKQLKEMVIYMNIIDGISHNSGTLLDKMVDFELEEKLKDKSHFIREKNDYTEKLNTVMNAKELKNPRTVVNVVSPILRQSPDKFQPFKDSLWKVENIGENPVSTKDQLKLIGLKKNVSDVLKRVKRNIDDAKSLTDIVEKRSAMHLAGNALKIVSDVFQEAGFTKEAEEIFETVHFINETLLYKIHEEKNYKILDEKIHEALNKLDKIYNKINSMFV